MSRLTPEEHAVISSRIADLDALLSTDNPPESLRILDWVTLFAEHKALKERLAEHDALPGE